MMEKILQVLPREAETVHPSIGNAIRYLQRRQMLYGDRVILDQPASLIRLSATVDITKNSQVTQLSDFEQEINE